MGLVLMKALFALVVLLVAAPLSAALTFLLSPFWRWLEARSGVESVGHSGPAGWCYGVVYLVLVSILLVAYLIRAGRRSSESRARQLTD